MTTKPTTPKPTSTKPTTTKPTTTTTTTINKANTNNTKNDANTNKYDPFNLDKGWIIVSNFIMMLGWLRVVVLFLNPATALCDYSTNIHIALYFSFLELMNSIMGVTKSKPQQVLLFSTIRFGVESIVTPRIGCNTWQHLFTVVCWSMGDTIRFGCYFFDTLFDNPSIILFKYIRYTIGPILFPLGTVGEMMMVFTLAQQDNTLFGTKVFLYFASIILWPLGFIYLFQQLLRQRTKFLNSINKNTSNKTPIKVKV